MTGSSRPTVEADTAHPHDPAALEAGAPGAMLVIISGPSGVGKDTIIEALRRRP
jgi:putative ribosome biogenesis GTPase RsgA